MTHTQVFGKRRKAERKAKALSLFLPSRNLQNNELNTILYMNCFVLFSDLTLTEKQIVVVLTNTYANSQMMIFNTNNAYLILRVGFQALFFLQHIFRHLSEEQRKNQVSISITNNAIPILYFQRNKTFPKKQTFFG